MMERWKDIPGYEGLYQVSDQGRVRYKKTGWILKQSKSKKGYITVTIKDNSTKVGFRSVGVHRLVYAAFNDPIPEGMEVNHINQKRDDNRLENLNLLTHKENINWGTGPELRAKAHYKKVYQYDLEGNLIREWESVKSIQEETGWKKGFIANCCRELPHFKTAYGFIWKYEKL